MKTPSTTMELAGAIESLIGSYIAGVREAAQQAVERALVRSSAGRPTRSGRTGPTMPPTSANRRTAAEMAEVCNALSEAVRANPGASMVTLAETMGAEARTLQRPMAALRATGRVRSVGQRHLTRYYPAVVRAAAAKD